MRLSTRMLFMISAVSLLIMALYAAFEGRRLFEEKSAEAMESHRAMVANSVSLFAQSLWTYDDAMARTQIATLLKNGTFVDVRVVDKEGGTIWQERGKNSEAVKRSANGEKLPFHPKRPIADASDEEASVVSLPVLENRYAVRMVAPLFQKTDEGQPEFLGHLVAEFSNRNAVERALSFVTHAVVASLLLALMISAISAIFLRYFVAVPIAELDRASGELAHGRFPRLHRIKGRDEISNLSRNFNGMVDRLEANSRLLSTLGRLSRRIADIRSVELLSSYVAQEELQSLIQVVAKKGRFSLYFTRGTLERLGCQAKSSAACQTVDGEPLEVQFLSVDPLVQYRDGRNPILFPIEIGGNSGAPGACLALFDWTGLEAEFVGALAPLAASMESCLKNVEFALAQKDEGLRKAEMEAAALVQSALVPRESRGEKVDIAAYFHPADRAGGDWYGLHFDERRRVHYFFVGDVTGHGIASAIVSGVLCGAVLSGERRADLIENPDASAPENRLRAMAGVANSVLKQVGEPSQRCATMLFLGLEIDTGRLHYIVAGHPPCLVLNRVKGVRSLAMGGSRLGSQEEVAFKVHTELLVPGETLFMFTDGLVENHAEKQPPMGLFGLKKVLGKLVGNANAEQEVISFVLNEARPIWGEEAPKDDVTMLTVRWVS